MWRSTCWACRDHFEKNQQPNAEDAKDSQRTQKEIPNFFWLFFCVLCEIFASSASGCLAWLCFRLFGLSERLRGYN